MTTLAAIAGSLRRGSVNWLLPRGRPALTRQAAPDPCRLADRAGRSRCRSVASSRACPTSDYPPSADAVPGAWSPSRSSNCKTAR
jgi:hypothetical protein